MKHASAYRYAGYHFHDKRGDKYCSVFVVGSGRQRVVKFGLQYSK